jgi:hypothetical protein
MDVKALHTSLRDIANTYSAKLILNISTASISGQAHPEVAARPAYTLSKLSGTLLFQLLASDIPYQKNSNHNFPPRAYLQRALELDWL